MAKMVYEKLKQADEIKGTKKAIVTALKNMGKIASQHFRGKVYL